ncbi:MAG: NAD+ synthase [Xanthomonadales bacterium]|nr:NAD+ synthase [Xanthomonadales bacterium]NNK38648.1 NAD+ synthase [Xanthomonadales bacterium]
MIRIALAQFDFLVGDIPGNLEKSRELIGAARDAGADLVLFPEMALTGYPPEDLLLRPGFLGQSRRALDLLAAEVNGIDVVMGHVWSEGDKRYNAVSWIRDGRVIGRYAKQHLPNYLVFDEERYFSEGGEPLVVELKGSRVAVIICEDAWESGPALQAREHGADLLLIPNASPYRDDKMEARLRMLAERHGETSLPMVYCNLTGGQDELVFDGRSLLVDGQGAVTARGPLCEEALLMAEFHPDRSALEGAGWKAPPDQPLAEIYTVLQTGLRDYVRKNGFSDVVFGLSGGIDSSLTLALAVDAFGPERVHTVMMPSRHTSGLSIELAQEQAVALGVDHRCISIEPAFEALQTLLAPSFGDRAPDITEENLQARIRGDIVMALSNKFGWLPLATSNKSELAVGYCTIYGDMCGGFGPLLDCIKMRVYELSRYRNTLSLAIPEAVITRAPSAELRPDQSDQDSLPPYEVLDQVLIRYVEQDWSIAQLVEAGFEESMVRRVAGLVLMNEYKRRQAPPGVRITHRAFGRDRRYPITSGWRDSDFPTP